VHLTLGYGQNEPVVYRTIGEEQYLIYIGRNIIKFQKPVGYTRWAARVLLRNFSDDDVEALTRIAKPDVIFYLRQGLGQQTLIILLIEPQ
jgi:hypothetical protein